MTMKKMLAVLLCMALLMGTMVAAAYAVQPSADQVSVADATDEETDETDDTEELTFWEEIAAWWADFYPKFVDIWDTGFSWVSNILVLGFQWLLVLVGLR